MVLYTIWCATHMAWFIYSKLGLLEKHDRIEAFEIWCWIRLLRKTQMDSFKNEDVFKRVEEERTMWRNSIIKKKKQTYHEMDLHEIDK